MKSNLYYGTGKTKLNSYMLFLYSYMLFLWNSYILILSSIAPKMQMLKRRKWLFFYFFDHLIYSASCSATYSASLSASWTHGLIAHLVRASQQSSVVVGSNLTQANLP